MSPLFWKVYSEFGELVGALREAEDAAAVVNLYEGGTIKANGRIVWREGRESQSAGESFDFTAELCRARLALHQHESYTRAHRAQPAARAAKES